MSHPSCSGLSCASCTAHPKAMFCYQCEQTAFGKGCQVQGVCGKDPTTAALQDLLIYSLKGLSTAAIEARNHNISTESVDLFIYEGLFATVTNVDFDEDKIINLIRQSSQYRDKLINLLKDAGIEIQNLHPAVWTIFPESKAGLLEGAPFYGVLDRKEMNPDIQSLKSTVLFGIKGIAAYADHAAILGERDPAISHFLQKALASMLRYDLSLENWIGLAMECGQVNLRTMELLDKANTGHYGHPVPTQVSLGTKKGKAILVSGHDLRDLEMLLQQTLGKGISIYTHGEMLPCHGYPELKKYAHLCGHWGTAWQNQHKEFNAFPGAILMTTNCIQAPLPSYQDRIFSTGLVAFPGVTHIEKNAKGEKDFTPVITKALALTGFDEDGDGGSVTTGFARNAVMQVAGKVIDAVKNKKIRHFFLVAGCDGAKPGRNYYTEFVEKVPKDCIILTLACGKFRFFDKQLGDIDGIPRLLDIGQCNDAYSAVKIALALSEAFGVDVNHLPLSLVLSWYEQKAVAILLTLLSLGIKNIRLGPSLPAFLSPNVLNFLVDKFNIKPISTPDEDLKAILG